MNTPDHHRNSDYVPALRFHALTRFYDRLLSATTKEEKFRDLLLAQANVGPSHRVLDLGCGTGTFAILTKLAVPTAEVVGLDADKNVLAFARKKAETRRVDITFCCALAHKAPFEDGTFDRITSTLFFHHLTLASKLRTLERARALLRPGGEIHIADWGAPQNAMMRVAFFAVQLLDGFETTADNVAGMLPSLMFQAGFDDVAETHREATIFGTLSMYRGTLR
jgi:ubiquinone/menaquinone biosynthesis C-methylase UbiE